MKWNWMELSAACLAERPGNGLESDEGGIPIRDGAVPHLKD